MAKIHEALLAIQENVPTLEKNGTGPQTQGSYKFLAVDDVLKGLKPLLNKHGVVVVPNLIDHGFHYNSALAKDNERVPRESIQAWVKYDFEYIAAEDGSSVHSVVVGEGIDTQDKAIRKATTSAWKISLIQTFSLVTGEIDPDAQDGAADAQGAAPAAANPAQAKLAKATAGATAKPAAAVKGNGAAELRNQIITKSKAVAESTGIPETYYRNIGDRLTGTTNAADRKWINDTKVLTEVLAAIDAGETE